MHPDLRSVHQHMLGLGLGALAHANWHANYWTPESQHWSELSVLQAAHAAEILIKSRIAEEHPLLIFDQLPRSTQVGTDLLGFQQLIERGRTIQYFELPERLWAATGLRLTNLERFNEFGKLRNTVQHFALPENRDFSQVTIEFIYSVIDPFINECWGLCAIDYNEDSEPYIYLVEGLVNRGILFFVSPEAAAAINQAELPWPNDEYRMEMERRFLAATEQ
jgi:hypothetical protein